MVIERLDENIETVEERLEIEVRNVMNRGGL
jgi:hypothetical protein